MNIKEAKPFSFKDEEPLLVPENDIDVTDKSIPAYLRQQAAKVNEREKVRQSTIAELERNK